MLEIRGFSIPIDVAALCIECDRIFGYMNSADRCPCCHSRSWLPLQVMFSSKGTSHAPQ